LTAGDDGFRLAVMGFLLNERRVDINNTPACSPIAPNGLQLVPLDGLPGRARAP
jgi:hypothetical protein